MGAGGSGGGVSAFGGGSGGGAHRHSVAADHQLLCDHLGTGGTGGAGDAGFPWGNSHRLNVINSTPRSCRRRRRRQRHRWRRGRRILYSSAVGITDLSCHRQGRGSNAGGNNGGSGGGGGGAVGGVGGGGRQRLFRRRRRQRSRGDHPDDLVLSSRGPRGGDRKGTIEQIMAKEFRCPNLWSVHPTIARKRVRNAALAPRLQLSRRLHPERRGPSVPAILVQLPAAPPFTPARHPRHHHHRRGHQALPGRLLCGRALLRDHPAHRCPREPRCPRGARATKVRQASRAAKDLQGGLGTQGAQGQGAQGNQGSARISGLPGLLRSPSNSQYTGRPGIPGLPGFPRVSGFQGVAGTGSQGAQGSQGFRGIGSGRTWGTGLFSERYYSAPVGVTWIEVEVWGPAVAATVASSC